MSSGNPTNDRDYYQNRRPKRPAQGSRPDDDQSSSPASSNETNHAVFNYPTSKPSTGQGLLTVPDEGRSGGRQRERYPEGTEPGERPRSILRRSISRNSPPGVTSVRGTIRNTSQNSGTRMSAVQVNAKEAEERVKEREREEDERLLQEASERRLRKAREKRDSGRKARAYSPSPGASTPTGGSSRLSAMQDWPDDRRRGGHTSRTADDGGHEYTRSERGRRDYDRKEVVEYDTTRYPRDGRPRSPPGIEHSRRDVVADTSRRHRRKSEYLAPEGSRDRSHSRTGHHERRPHRTRERSMTDHITDGISKLLFGKRS